MQQKNLKKNALFNFIKAFMSICFPIISFPYASRILMPEGIGKVNFANSLIEYFMMIASMGISAYAAREAAKIRDDKQKLNTFSKEILFINLISTFFAYLALVICFVFVDKFGEYRVLIIICSTKILFTTIGLEWLYYAEEEYGYITLRQTIFQILSLVLLFAFVHDSSDYYIYAGIGVFANVGANIFNFIHSRKFINLLEGTSLNVRKHLKPIFTFFGINCAYRINNTLDAVMLGFISGNIAVGFYSAAIKINRMVIELISSSISTFMPRSSYYVEVNKEHEYHLLIEKACSATFFFAIPAAAGLCFLCRPLVILFTGEQYLPAVSSMRVLSLCVIGTCANSFLNSLIISPQRKEQFTFIAQIVAAFFNIVLNILLINRFDVLGAAIATAIVEFILPLVLLIPSWKFMGTYDNAKEVGKALLGTIFMLGILYLGCSKIQSTILKTSVSITLGCAIYAISEIVLQHKTALLLIQVIRTKLRK